MKSRLLLLLVCLVFMPGLAVALNVSGIVTDEANDPIVGASVICKGTSVGTATDIDGRFTLDVPESGATIQVSYVGMLPLELPVRPEMKIVMKENTNDLDEVVVIGYGTVKKKDVLGSITTVKDKDLQDRTSGNILESMRGLTSGVKITNSGQAGSSPSMVIRGLGSLTNNTPLFIIDGAYAGNELGVNVEDIESIQVLKDASSAAIYGSRAANGVVIIKTKSGRSGGLKVKFDTQIQLNWLPRYDLMDAETYKLYDDRAYDEAILAGVAGVTNRQDHYKANTDWQDEMLRTGLLQNYNVALSGGNDNLNFYTSFNYLNDKGAMKYTGFEKYGFRVNTAGKKGIFSYGENLYYTYSKTKVLNGIGNVWSNFISMPPTIPVRDPEHGSGFGYGDSNHANSYGLNPVAMQELENRVNKQEYLFGNIYGQVEYPEWARAKVNVAYKTYNGTTDKLRKTGSWTMGQGDDAADISWNESRYHDILIEQTYEFFHKFGGHDINVLAGMSYNHFTSNDKGISRQNPAMSGDHYLTEIDAATGTVTGSGSYGEYSLISYFGRINYSYGDRYLVQLTGRRDGTSKLPNQRRWGNFFSGSLGWRISQEKFFDVDWVDDLKIRANYGSLGNSNIGNWDYVATLNSGPRAVFGTGETVAIGTTQSRLVNTDLVWEKKTTLNVGLDFTTLNSRLRFTADYFQSKSKDLLVYLPILMSTGNEGGAPAVNAGSLSNRGVEFELSWNDRAGDFSYSASLNLSHVKNRVDDLGYGQTAYLTSTSKSEIGQSLGMWYMYKMLGIFQSQEEINSYKNADGKVIQPNALPGDIKYDDYNGDGQISSEDRQIVGNPWPKLEMGFNFSASWRGIDFALNSYGRFGQEVYNGAAYAAGDFQNNQNNFNGIVPWTQEHPVNDRPRIVYGDSRNTRGDQDRWLEDGSFFRISDITLGYSLPTRAIRKIGLEKVRFAVTGKNLVTFTKYSGLDPEFADGGIWTIGYDGCSFPNPRAVQFAVSLTF
jgi:TonB-linked SusC/RagA family outer membrane protein